MVAALALLFALHSCLPSDDTCPGPGCVRTPAVHVCLGDGAKAQPAWPFM